MAGPLSRLERAEVIERLERTGSYDPDVLYAETAALLKQVRMPRIVGLCLVVAGSASLVEPILVWLGVPTLVAGWWLYRRGSRNVATVEAAYTQLMRRPSG